VSKGSGLQDGLSLTCPRTLRAATRTCSRSHACAGSFVRRGCQLMKYGNGLSSRGVRSSANSLSALSSDAVRRGTIQSTDRFLFSLCCFFCALPESFRGLPESFLCSVDSYRQGLP